MIIPHLTNIKPAKDPMSPHCSSKSANIDMFMYYSHPEVDRILMVHRYSNVRKDCFKFPHSIYQDDDVFYIYIYIYIFFIYLHYAEVQNHFFHLIVGYT